MNSGGTMTFSQMLSRVEDIEIPIIQRDYAQGRKSALEVRAQFLETILATLSKEPGELDQPLDLDFVYGSINVNNKFWPLDGQQRLTTLFLLHWYLACRDGRFEAFRNMLLKEGKSRFTYETRRSSAEFFSALAGHEVDLQNLAYDSVSAMIRDANWFFIAWEQDPTIQSVLNMLDSIDRDFRDHEGLYDRITATEQPYITFQFLNLEEFGLSDDLYIKMNARGKPLTPFENFKANFEQFVGEAFEAETKQLAGSEVSFQDYLGIKIDTDWTDLFWRFCGADTEQFDEQVMEFFRSVISVLYVFGKTREDRAEVSNILSEIRNRDFKPSFYQYQKSGCIDRELVLNLDRLMTVLCSLEGKPTFLEEKGYYDEEATFRRALEKLDPRGGRAATGLTYQRAIQFFAWSTYLIKNRAHIEPARLFDWMRVVHNLSENTRVELERTFADTLFSLMDLLEHADSIIDYLGDSDEEQKIVAFYAPQVREERIKAQLIKRTEEWSELIYRAEQHGYFKGQIEFLLDYCGVLEHFLDSDACDWNEDEDRELRTRFANYLEKSEVVFDEDGLREFPDHLFERALLTKGDYLLFGRSNFSFLDDDSRDTSWKRLLRGSERAGDEIRISEKRMLLRDLLDDLDVADPVGSLERCIVEAVGIDDWRLPVIQEPNIIDFCEKRYIRKISDDSFYLLKRIQMNGAHLELWSHFLFLDYISKLSELYPFDYADECPSYNSEHEPGIRLHGMVYDETPAPMWIIHRDGFYETFVKHDSIHEALEGLFGAELDESGHTTIVLSRDEFRDCFPLLLNRLGALGKNRFEVES